MVAVAIPVCKKKRTDNALQSCRAGRAQWAALLRGLVNHDPFIEGVLSEGSVVMGRTHRLELGGKTTFSIIVVVIVRRAIGGHWPVYYDNTSV